MTVFPLFVHDISIHAPREGSDGLFAVAFQATKISIHAPREGSDIAQQNLVVNKILISIHAPREGSDSCSAFTTPTPPDFYPRSPRGERREYGRSKAAQLQISIHAPREGSDTPPPARPTALQAFLSTLPARGATSAC